MRCVCQNTDLYIMSDSASCGYIFRCNWSPEVVCDWVWAGDDRGTV